MKSSGRVPFLLAARCALEILTCGPHGVGLQLLRQYASLAAASLLLLLLLLLRLLLLCQLLLLLLLFVRAAPVRFVHLRMHKMTA